MQSEQQIEQTISNAFEDIKSKIRIETGCSNVSYHTWLEPLSFLAFSDNTAFILIPFGEDDSNKFHYNYLNTHYLTPFKFFLSEAVGEMIEARFLLRREADELNLIDTKGGEEREALKDDIPEQDSVQGGIFLPDNASQSGFLDKYRFESFIVGNNNRLAYAAALAVAEAPGLQYNPLFIYGASGLGKTHLMNAIGRYIIEHNPGSKVLYATAEQFMNEVIDSIRNGKNDPKIMTAFRERYRSADVLMIDDIQFILGKDSASTQEEFFHTFNELHQSGRQIVLSSDRSPKEMERLDERFRSRFEMGLLTDIKSPDYETRMAILKHLAENFPCTIDDEAFAYIATNVRVNIRELEGTFNQLIAFVRMHNLHSVTIVEATEALKDYISPDKQKIITIRNVIDTVCEHYDISIERLRARARDKEIVVPRQIVMYLCREYCNNATLKEIATALGKKDHTTVSSGVDKIKTELSRDPELARTVEIIVNKLNPVS